MDCEDEWNDAELTDETLVALLAALEGKALERKKVLLAANRLTCACLPSLSAFAHVKYLLLAHNRISELHGLPCWSTLTVLCLDDNRLVTLDGFPPLVNLEVLNLYNNLLESLQGLPLLPKLNWLELRNNPRLSKHLALCSDTEEQCKQVMAHWVRLRNCQAARCALYSLLRQNDVTRDLAPTISAMGALLRIKRSIDQMDSVTVHVTHGKNVYADVRVDPSCGTEEFRATLYSLTGVPPERQKVMGFKGGALKDGVAWDKLGLKPGLKLMLIGNAGELPKAPTAQEIKEEEEEKPANELQFPVGLQNLGNTCFMNSTLQCLRKVPELRDALVKYQPGNAADQDKQLTQAAGALFRTMDNVREPQPPFVFLTRLHSKYPQFAEKGPQGGLMQHDAEEVWNSFLMSVGRSVPRSGAAAGEAVHQENSIVSELFQGTMETTLKCIESDAEAPVVLDEHFQKLTCNIDKDTSSVFGGMETAMSAGGVEKNSQVLGRSAQWTKSQKIKQLPQYLTIQFVRFYWRQDVNKGAGDKAKICKPVSFPTELDMYGFCTPDLKTQLDAARKAGASATADTGAAQPMDTSDDHASVTGKYELFAVLSHRGRSADSGHYVAWTKYVPRPDEKLDRKDLWVCWDDDKPSYVTEEEVKKLSGNGGADWHIAYMLLYRPKH